MQSATSVRSVNLAATTQHNFFAAFATNITVRSCYNNSRYNEKQVTFTMRMSKQSSFSPLSPPIQHTLVTTTVVKKLTTSPQQKSCCATANLFSAPVTADICNRAMPQDDKTLSRCAMFSQTNSMWLSNSIDLEAVLQAAQYKVEFRRARRGWAKHIRVWTDTAVLYWHSRNYELVQVSCHISSFQGARLSTALRISAPNQYYCGRMHYEFVYCTVSSCELLTGWSRACWRQASSSGGADGQEYI